MASQLQRKEGMNKPAAVTPRSRRRVFLVDDDLRTARRLAAMLEEDGFVVEVMRDGDEAVARLEREPTHPTRS